MQHAWGQDVSAFGENAGQFGPQEVQPLPHRNAALQQEGAYLVDDAGARPTNRSRTRWSACRSS
jgi:hypothetical protein